MRSRSIPKGCVSYHFPTGRLRERGSKLRAASRSRSVSFAQRLVRAASRREEKRREEKRREEKRREEKRREEKRRRQERQELSFLTDRENKIIPHSMQRPYLHNGDRSSSHSPRYVCSLLFIILHKKLL
jgi:hypothetical protein